MSHAAADVVAIADQLGLGQFGVCGISGGGPHALAVAARHPDRVRRCATVVGLGPFGVPGMPAGDRQQWAWVQQGEQAVVEHVVPGMMSWLDAPGHRRTPKGMTDWVRRMLVQSFREAFAPGPGGGAGDFRSFVQPWGFDVADVAAPTRIMVASQDETVPPGHGQWLARHIPGAQLITWLASHEA